MPPGFWQSLFPSNKTRLPVVIEAYPQVVAKARIACCALIKID